MLKKIGKIAASAFVIAVIAAALVITSFASSGVYDSLSYTANADDANTVIKTQITEYGERYLFLPSSAELTELTLTYDESVSSLVFKTQLGQIEVVSGQPFDLTSLFDAETDKYAVTVIADGEESELTVMKSAKVRTMYIVSSDPVNAGRLWVDAVKGNEADGKLSFLNADGTVSYSGKLSEIKGRGNSTFRDYKKKPYQIKIKDKVDLIGGTEEEANKKWVLLANAPDYTFAHNNVTFALANMIGLTYTSIYESIDLYYDGEYRGTYCLTEKVETGSSRVDIDEMDDVIEELNAENPALDAEVSVTKTRVSGGQTDAAENSKGSVKYIEGLYEPELGEGMSHHAYLLELEYSFRYPDEISGFVSDRGQCVVTKSPELLTKDMSVFIADFWQQFEDAVYSENGYNAQTGKYYYDYVDLDSLVNLFLINELGKNQDSFGSSFFFYMPADSDKLIAGPVWDYDLCYGVGHIYREMYSDPENFLCYEKSELAKALLSIESFRDAVKAALDKDTGYFYNAVQELLGDTGVIAEQTNRVYQSQKLNFALWDIYAEDYYQNAEDSTDRIVVLPGAEPTYDNAVAFFEYFVEERIEWLSEQTAAWDGENYTIRTDSNVYAFGDDATALYKIQQFFKSLVDFFLRIIEWFKSIFS